jgi:hypothetical protein
VGDDQTLMTALDITRHDRMVALVTQTAAGVDLHARLAAEGVLHNPGRRLRSSGASR